MGWNGLRSRPVDWRRIASYQFVHYDDLYTKIEHVPILKFSVHFYLVQTSWRKYVTCNDVLCPVLVGISGRFITPPNACM